MNWRQCLKFMENRLNNERRAMRRRGEAEYASPPYP
jgi:hypothetical protein